MTKFKSMYLETFTIRNFRSCSDMRLRLQPELTLLVGENNSGKSNVIDALRLATRPSNDRRSRYFEEEDLAWGVDRPIELVAEYADLTTYQWAQYMGAADLDSPKCTYGVRYDPTTNLPPRLRVENLSGKILVPDAEPEARARINHVYLAPLRDAHRELGSGTGTRLLHIVNTLVEISEQERGDFIEAARKRLHDLEAMPLLEKTREEIQTNVSKLTDAVRGQTIGLGFEDSSLRELIRGLRVKMADHNINPTDLTASGSGYANLLFLATVLLELRNAKDAELTLFLVEEPEAHLHPQLQHVLLEYLKDQAAASAHDDSLGPAGRVQVVATTHSPNLASSVGTMNLVVLRRDFESADASTKAVALSEIKLAADEKPAVDSRRKIDQYLDVTRSTLLFGRRIVLVEGLSEAVLLPVLARVCAFSEDPVSQQAFRAIPIINIGNVDFEPYVRLLLAPVDGIRLAERLVVITDGDPLVQHDSGSEGNQPIPITHRVAKLRNLARDLAAEDHLHVASGRHTLEADLLEPGPRNVCLLGQAFLRQRPRSQAHWAKISEAKDPPVALYEELRSNSDFLAKGQFAHDVAQLIEDGGPFECPQHLETAIRWIIHRDVRP